MSFEMHSCRDQAEDRPADADLDVVGMGTNEKGGQPLAGSRKIEGFHDPAGGSTTAASGMGTMNLPPQVPMWRIWRTISSLRFQGSIST